MDFNISYHSSESVRSMREHFYDLFNECPIPRSELLSNVGLFIRRQCFIRMLLMNDLYLRNCESGINLICKKR